MEYQYYTCDVFTDQRFGGNQLAVITDARDLTDNHPPQVASVGLPFLIAELRDKSTLQKAKVNIEGFEKIAALGITPDIFIYTKSEDEFDIRARMFAPFDGIMEDPATLATL